MLEILKFVFSSFWHWIGFAILLLIVLFICGSYTYAVTDLVLKFLNKRLEAKDRPNDKKQIDSPTTWHFPS